jgi:hypothetical protein
LHGAILLKLAHSAGLEGVPDRRLRMEIMDDPYPETPGQRDRTESELLKRIESMPEIPPELRKEVAKRRAEFLEARIQQGAGHFYGGQLGWTNWFIRNDDLDLLALLAPSATGIATYATVAAASPWVLAATLLFSVLAVARKLRAKSTTLDPDECRVLMALKQTGGASLTALANVLNHVTLVGTGPWTEERVLKTLDKLRSVSVGDGSIETYVVQAADGRWSTNGV